MAFFRLLAGKHIGPMIDGCGCERCTTDVETLKGNVERVKNKQSPKSLKGHMYNPGDIVESQKDLVSRFPNKFQMVDRTGRAMERPRATEDDDRQQPAQNDFLNTMTREELENYAAESQVDVSKCKTKPEIMNAIRRTVGAMD